MSLLMSNNSSLSIQSDASHDELMEYLLKVNRILFFVQAFITIMGVLGNLLAVIVINRKPLKSTSSAVFITYMAIFDTAVLLVHAANLAKPRRNLVIHCASIYLTDLSTFCANWVLVIITLERCVAVYSPFLAKRLCTIHSARRSMYILLTISIIFFSVTFPLIYHTGEPSKNETSINGTKRNYKCYINPKSGLLVRIYQPILFYAIPDLLLLSNLFTVYSLCRRRQQLSSAYYNNGDKLELRINDVHSNRKQRQLTIMLVTVSLSFYLFTTPAIIHYIAESRPRVHRNIKKIKQDFLFSQISVIFLQLNNATNFIFYCLSGQRFRLVTVQTFHYYSRQLKIFYHRYILCDKRYHAKPVYQHRLSGMGNTMMITRTSCIPNSSHQQRRGSTI